MGMMRVELQRLAELRLTEAINLLDDGSFSLAYYVAGYVVELGLKACIANLFKSEEFPDKKFSDKCYIHDLNALVALADLVAERIAQETTDPVFKANWDTVTGWSESSRYENTPEAKARKLIAAITDASHGVLPWIKRFW